MYLISITQYLHLALLPEHHRYINNCDYVLLTLTEICLVNYDNLNHSLMIIYFINMISTINDFI